MSDLDDTLSQLLKLSEAPTLTGSGSLARFVFSKLIKMGRLRCRVKV